MADARFTLDYRGKPLTITGTNSAGGTMRTDAFEALALIPGPTPAFIVRTNDETSSGEAWLLVPEGDSVRTENLGFTGYWLTAAPLTNDTARFVSAAAYAAPGGRVNEVTFATPGLYLFTGFVLDTRTRTVQAYAAAEPTSLVDRIGPLGVSPDEKHFVQLASGDNGDYLFLIKSIPNGEPYTLPIDGARMRFKDIDQLSPLYVDHYFEWKRGTDGTYRLVPRTNVTPLVYRGALSIESDYSEYRIGPAQETLLEPIVALVMAEFKGERLPKEEYGSSVRLLVGADTVNLMYSEGSNAHVGIWTDRGSKTTLMQEIAPRIDAALATRRYDEYFER